MQKIFINDNNDQNLFVINGKINSYLSNDSEVLSGATPSWKSGYPKFISSTATTAQFGVAVMYATVPVYFVVLNRDAPEPSNAQIIAGQDSTGTPVSSGFSGFNLSVGFSEVLLNASNLVGGSNYDVWFAANPGGVGDIKVQFSTLVEAPVISVQPQDQDVQVEGTLTLTVTASGTEPLSYQWYKGITPLSDGGRISGVLTDTLIITLIQSSDAGSYHVVVSNGILPDAISNDAVLTVVPLIRYVNLSKVTDGNNGNTEETAYSYTDWQTFLGTAPEPATFYIWGSKETNRNTDFGIQHTYFKNQNVLEPFRLSTKTTRLGSNINGGIIFVPNNYVLFQNYQQPNALTFTNLYIRTTTAPETQGFKFENGAMNFKGCTFNGPKFLIDSDTVLNFLDCIVSVRDEGIVDFIPGSPAESVVFTKCAIDAGGVFNSGNTSYNQCQKTWDSSSINFPTWNDDKEFFAKDILLFGITDPPSSGTSPYTGYATDPWGSVRNSIGAVSSQSVVKYVDLSVTGSGHSGAIGNPYSWDEFKIAVESFASNLFYIKGEKEVALWPDFTGNNPLELRFLPWPDNSPFRISVTGTGFYDALVGTWENCILNFTNSLFVGGVFYGYSKAAHLRTVSLSVTDEIIFSGSLEAPSDIYGSNLRSNDKISSVVGGVTIKDTLIDTPEWYVYYGAPEFTLLNCAVSSLRSDIIESGIVLADTDCQFDWIPPVWPAWDAAKASFYISILLAGVTTPPQPGNLPYTRYETDLFGGVRSTIGAVSTSGIGPVISIQPQSQQIELGGILNISVSATGTGTLHYQWKKNGNNIGTDSASFVSNPFNGSDQGTYTVDVTDSSGTVVSDSAVITFIPEPFVDFRGPHWDRNKPGFKQAAPATNIHILGSNPISGERIVEEDSTHY